MIGEDGVRTETVWSCMQCNACVEICPVGIEQAPIINQLRRRLVEEGELDPNLQSTLQTIHKSGNSFGENKRRRGRWAKELDFEVPDARKQPVDVLWFVGDYASFDPRSQQVSQTLARLLHEAGVDFGILYDGERNAGNDVRRVGEEGLFETLAEQNIETLAGCEFNRIVTTDPHSLNTLRNEYPALGGELAGRAPHDAAAGAAARGQARAPAPARASRHLPRPVPPRALQRRVRQPAADPGAARLHARRDAAQPRQLVLLRRRRRPDLDPGQARARSARRRTGSARPSSLDEVDYFVVSCPKDVTMYEDAIKTSGNADRIELRELTELVQEALVAAAEPATRLSRRRCER